ncbi:MAG TPA: exodeoxyribonuclease VII small subunit [Candidatus Saccharimonadales bacterium]|nr:exodeoxyribonuclease VII small subunit [Candidatus Saccharimonadales bacterium]
MSSTKNLNDQLNELDTLLTWFEQPNIDLEEALQKFDQGVALAESIKKRLVKIENKITVLKERFDIQAS